jgi:hypothetical protein
MIARAPLSGRATIALLALRHAPDRVGRPKIGLLQGGGLRELEPGELAVEEGEEEERREQTFHAGTSAERLRV